VATTRLLLTSSMLNGERRYFWTCVHWKPLEMGVVMRDLGFQKLICAFYAYHVVICPCTKPTVFMIT
jgi:hypothetical protein